MRTLLISDIHGYYDEMVSCLNNASFNPETDKLIFLGDICDRGTKTLECIQYFNTLPNKVCLMGNHDLWLMYWLKQELHSRRQMDSMETAHWINTQGGRSTLDSINKENYEFVLNFLENMLPYYTIQRDLFVHGGIYHKSKAEDNNLESIAWNRDMIKEARYHTLERDPFVENYDLVFCGHTPTQYFNHTEPVKYSNVWLIDTGICYGGKITAMDLETKKWWQNG